MKTKKVYVCWKEDSVEQVVEYDAETAWGVHKGAHDIAEMRGWTHYGFGTPADYKTQLEITPARS